MSDHLREIRMLDKCEEHTLDEWSVLGNDTVNLALVRRAAHGKHAFEFDKTNGEAGTVHAGASRTIQSANLNHYVWGTEICWNLYVSSLADIAYTWIRIGTSASHFVEYRFYDYQLRAGDNLCHVPLHRVASQTGNGADWGDIDYLAFGVAFDAEDDALADMAIDNICIMPAAWVPDEDLTEVVIATSDAAGSQKDSPYTSVGTSVVSITAPAKARAVSLLADAALRYGENATLDGTADDGYDYLPAYQKEVIPTRPGKLTYFRINAASGTCSVYFKFYLTAE
jgi:hypothetical protein